MVIHFDSSDFYFVFGITTMKYKSVRKSASKWEQASERALIQIWWEKMGELRRCRKNSHIIEEIVNELRKQGYVYSMIEIKTKMHNLTGRYRKEKRKVETTGGSPSEWDLYGDMQALLAQYKSYQSEGLVVDSINDISSDILADPLSPKMVSMSQSLNGPEVLKLSSSPENAFSPPVSTHALVTTPLTSPSMSEDSSPATSSIAEGRRKKAVRKSASKWEQASEMALIQIWREKMNELRNCRKNSHIIMDMVEQLRKQGYVYSLVELKTKMHNMTARYRKEKRKVESEGGAPSEWDMYGEMQSLLDPHKSDNPKALVLDSINNINSNVLVDPSSSMMTSSLPSPSVPKVSPLLSSSKTIFSCPSSPLVFATTPLPSSSMSEDSSPAPSPSAAERRKKGLALYFKRFDKKLEMIHNDIKISSEKLIAIEMEKKEILKSYVEKEAEVQSELIKFLKRQ